MHILQREVSHPPDQDYDEEEYDPDDETGHIK